MILSFLFVKGLYETSYNSKCLTVGLFMSMFVLSVYLFVCVCVCMFMWFMRTQICIMT